MISSRLEVKLARVLLIYWTRALNKIAAINVNICQHYLSTLFVNIIIYLFVIHQFFLRMVAWDLHHH